MENKPDRVLVPPPYKDERGETALAPVERAGPILRRCLFALFVTVVCWLALSVLLTAIGHYGPWWENFVRCLEDAAELDEEVIFFTCILLLSLSVAMSVLALGGTGHYAARFVLPALGILYACVALAVSPIIRPFFKQPWDVWFHTLFSIAVSACFVALFGLRYMRILRYGAGGQGTCNEATGSQGEGTAANAADTQIG